MLAGMQEREGLERLGVDDDFDTAIVGSAGCGLIVADGMIGAVSDDEELLSWQVVASNQLVHDGLRLSAGELVRGAELTTVKLTGIGVTFDADALPRELAADVGGDLIEKIAAR